MFTTSKWHEKVRMMVRTPRDEAMMLKSSPSLGHHGGIQCGQTINKYKSSKFQPEKMKALGEIVVEQQVRHVRSKEEISQKHTIYKNLFWLHPQVLV